MTDLDLSRLSVLIAEDAPFMRRLLKGMLRAVGVQRIHTAGNGAEAIATLQRVGDGWGADNIPEIDLVICDLVMPSLDGLAVLRWLRRHPESPNAYIPFVMISARSDGDVVAAARDGGVNEFIAKPFSADAVAKRLLSVITHPRQFVFAPGYFGPDRRRHRDGRARVERRKRSDAEIELFHSPKSPAVLARGADRVCLFRIKNRLRDKLGGDGGGDIDAERIRAAEAAIAEQGTEYGRILVDSVEALSRHCTHLEHAPADGAPGAADVTAKHLRAINALAHELRGLGGMFGYPLITAIGKSLYLCTQDLSALDDSSGTVNHPPTIPLLTLVKSHIDSIRLILRDDIRGDGGRPGAMLLEGLARATERRQTLSTEPPAS